VVREADWGDDSMLVELPAHDLSEAHRDFLRRELGITGMTNVEMDHCHESYGVVIDGEDGWRLVYSGDGRPCEELIKVGIGAKRY
jgi:ribonuclease BN (tRNA processing enzyme)